MQVASIWRHPIKSHGREHLDTVTLVPGKSMPFDRLWAVAHEAAQAEAGAWASCHSFARVSQAPALMAVTATLNEATGEVTLSHPNQPDLTVNPDTDPDALIAWSTPLVPQNRARPSHVMRLDGRGYTDSNFASLTLCNLASHRAVEAHMDQQLSIHRWRGNIWFQSGDPWAEFDWVGRDIKVGEAILRPRERTDRCLATASNPDTGQRDADTLKALDSFGHRDFSVRAEVIQGGIVRTDDRIELL